MNIKLSKNKEKEEEENSKLKEKIELFEKEKDELIKTNSAQSLIINKYEKYFNEEMKELENYQIQNSNIIFEDDPCDLKFCKELVSDRINSGLLYNIAVYVGLEDNLGYLVYQNLNYNLIIMRIYDQTVIKTLKGHKNEIRVIRYYHNKNNKIKDEEYILSCDSDKLIIIWDINNNFNQKYSIKENFKGDINDALILFNMFNKNYVITSSDNYGNYNEYTKLYEIKKNISFIKNIFNTNKNRNTYLIPWLYKNKYYLIACCDSEISINNIFEEETYATLKEKPEGKHYCGFLYNDNYLCVSDINNNFIRIWDLVNKTIYKTINFEGNYGYEMVQWNDKYTIICCDKCLIIIDLENGKEYKKIKGKNGKIFGLKKIKDEYLGECLICSQENNVVVVVVKKEEELDEEPDVESNDEY